MIDKPISVLDCGCGYGFLGLLLLPYLPEGSSYTGIDFAEDLIKKGKALFESQKLEADFLCENLFNCSVENQYDFLWKEKWKNYRGVQIWCEKRMKRSCRKF